MARGRFEQGLERGPSCDYQTDSQDASQKGLSLEAVSDVTGLSVEELETLS